MHLNTLITYLLVDDADCGSESEFLLFTVEKGQKLAHKLQKMLHIIFIFWRRILTALL